MSVQHREVTEMDAHLELLVFQGVSDPHFFSCSSPHLRFPSSDTHGPVPSDSFLAGSSPVRACLPSFLPDCPFPPRPPLLSQTFLFLSSFSASTKVPLLLLSTRGYSTAVVSVVLVPAEAFGVSVGFMPYNTLMETPRDPHS